MNGLVAFTAAIIPFLIILLATLFLFNMIFQIKKNSDIKIEQNKQIILYLEKIPLYIEWHNQILKRHLDSLQFVCVDVR